MLLVGVLLAGLIVFVLLFRLPGAEAVQRAGELSAAAQRLGWAVARADAASAVPRARARLDRALTALQQELQHAAMAPPELLAFQRRWVTLRAELDTLAPLQVADAALSDLATAAEGVADATNRLTEARHEELEWWLKGLTVALALTLLLPVHTLWRERQRMRHSLREISTQFGSGDWQDAVVRLRQDRLGAPSAFDALATGVEGVMGESDRRWRALADLSADWYWETDVRHCYSWVSGVSPILAGSTWKAQDMLGRRRDQLPFYEAPAGGWAEFHARLDRHESFRDQELRIKGRDGRALGWVAISGRARLDSGGRFQGYEGVGREITQQKFALEQLAANEQRWSLMAGLAADWYWETDEQHRLRPLRPEYTRRFPLLCERAEGLTRWQAFPQGLSPQQWADHRADMDERRPFRGVQFEADTGSGQYLWLSISGIPRFDGQGRFVGYHGVGRDVTLRRQAQSLLLRHNETLQAAVRERTRELEGLNRDLDAFARQLAHELRTPIGHVQGLSQLLATRAAARLSEDDQQLLALQVQAARNMNSTLDALMELARSSLQAMAMEAVDLSALVHTVLAELPAIERHAPVQWSVAPGLRAQGCPPALRMVFTNLLSNAAKFTRQVATPRVEITGGEDTDGRLRVRVRDNGAGFDPTQASRLFQPFNRLHSGEEFHGTGIGLTIVQRIVERHGGTVRAQGWPGQGAAFEFTLAR